ncbi:MAG: glycosyltransferase, partial [Halieaceae bacterium]|nr:glycosyltransferase [Halieaceae bacterium]
MKELSLIIPTFNESMNVEELVQRLEQALQGVEWEAIFVDDDSPDGTADIIRSMSASNSRVRCLQRIGRRGLSSACIEGMLSSAATYVAVMDADGQHDETILPHMLEEARDETVDLVVGSRYVEGGGVGEWARRRQSISRFAIKIARLI